MEQYTYLEWNVNARGGNGGKYTIPDWLSNYTTLTDIVVLTEFRCDNNWEKFKSDMEKEYYVFVSPYTTEWYNQVLVAVKKSRFKVKSVKTIDIMDDKLPEFLRVDVEDHENDVFSIIGTRIKTQVNDKKSQYDFLNKELADIQKGISLGDYNCTSKNLKDEIANGKVYGPRTKDNLYHSFIFDDMDKQGLDWLIVKGIDKVCNPFSDCDRSPYATYSWDFISKEHGFEEKTEDDFLNIDGLPDHAILKGAFSL